jgi:hypothetical protein
MARMLWLFLLGLAGVLGFVLSHKRRVNDVIPWTPPQTRAAIPVEELDAAAPPAEVSQTFNLNALYSSASRLPVVKDQSADQRPQA